MRIEQIKESFRIDAGAPLPRILSNELWLYVIFYIRKVDPNWDGSYVKVRDKSDEGIITLKFNLFAQFKFGNPNDETIEGHPYGELGLEPYSFQKLIDSDWIEQLKNMNAVHPQHKDEYFEKYNHYILFFHDTCLEIVAKGYEVLEGCEQQMGPEIARIGNLL